MTEAFQSLQQELDQKRAQLEHELAAVRGRAAEIEADLDRVHEALQALTGQRKKSRKAKSASKPATTVEHLQQHIASVRHENPFADATEMEKAVRALVQESGHSLANFKALFAEALLTSPGSQASGAHGVHHSHSAFDDHN